MARQLSGKQLNFVNEYLVDFNATQAAIRAKYSPHTARQQATRLLTKAHIQDAIVKRREDLQKEYDIATPVRN